jgi:hypothetical protein
MEPIQDIGHRIAHHQVNVAMAPYKWPKSNKRSGIWFLFLHFPVEEMFKKKNHFYTGDPSLPEHMGCMHKFSEIFGNSEIRSEI